MWPPLVAVATPWCQNHCGLLFQGGTTAWSGAAHWRPPSPTGTPSQALLAPLRESQLLLPRAGKSEAGGRNASSLWSPCLETDSHSSVWQGGAQGAGSLSQPGEVPGREAEGATEATGMGGMDTPPKEL